MKFVDIMQNLTIGIASGIYSSVIVSVVFYILNEYQNEVNKAKDMIYPLYGIVTMNRVRRISKQTHIIKTANKFYENALLKFENFEPKQFKYELRDILLRINDILADGKYFEDGLTINPQMIDSFSEEIGKQLNKFESFEKKFAIGFLKRIFKNKVIIITGVIFLALAIITITISV